MGERWVSTRWQAQADEHTGAEFTAERQFRLSGPSAHGGNGFLDDFSGENLPPCPTHTGARICGERQGGTHLSNHFHWRKRSKYMLSRYSRKGPPLRYSWTDLLGGKHRQKHSRSWSQAEPCPAGERPGLIYFQALEMQTHRGQGPQHLGSCWGLPSWPPQQAPSTYLPRAHAAWGQQ